MSSAGVQCESHVKPRDVTAFVRAIGRVCGDIPPGEVFVVTPAVGRRVPALQDALARHIMVVHVSPQSHPLNDTLSVVVVCATEASYFLRQAG